MSEQDALGIVIVGAAVLVCVWLLGRTVETARAVAEDDELSRSFDRASRAAMEAGAKAVIDARKSARVVVRKDADSVTHVHFQVCPRCGKLAVHAHDDAGGCYLRDLMPEELPMAEMALAMFTDGDEVEMAVGNPGGLHLCVLGPMPAVVAVASGLRVWSENCCRDGEER